MAHSKTVTHRALAVCLGLSSLAASACTPLRPLDHEGDAARPGLDAARADGGGLDAAADAWRPDAPLPDAPGLDASAPDAHGSDAFSPDAWAPDAYAPDAYAPDAYTNDAYVSPTPIRPTSTGDLVISEIMASPTGGTSDEWFELYNPSALQAFDLEGCDIQGRSSSLRIRSRLVVMPRAYVTLGAGSTPFPVDYEWTLGGPGVFTLDDNEDRVAISCTGRLIDEVLYDRTFPLVTRHSLMVSSSVLGGPSPATSNDLAASWCSAPSTASIDGRDFGTPGEINVCPP